MIYEFILLLRNPFLRKKVLTTWFSWIVVTTIGWFLAGLTSLPIGRVVVVEGGTSAIRSVASNMSLIGALIGGLASMGQWYFFRYRFSGAYLWVLATSAGWGVGLPVALVINLYFGLGISAGLYGLFVGAGVAIMQWLIFRKPVPDFGRWMVANLLAFVLGISGAGWLERYMLVSTGGTWGARPWETGISSALAGLVVGLITGIALIIMLINKNTANEPADD